MGWQGQAIACDVSALGEYDDDGNACGGRGGGGVRMRLGCECEEVEGGEACGGGEWPMQTHLTLAVTRQR